MGPHLRVVTYDDGVERELPRSTDKIVIYTEIGGIYIDLAEQVDNMVLMRSAAFEGGPGDTRLIMSPMDSGRMAVGVIRTPT